MKRKEFKIGDTVHWLRQTNFREGKVMNIGQKFLITDDDIIDHHLCDEDVVHVQFQNGDVNTFSLDGRFTKNQSRSLFFEYFEINIPLEAIEKHDLPNLKVNQKVIVWDGDRSAELQRCFSHFEDNKIYCFTDGCTSWSAYSRHHVIGWDHYEIINDNC